MTRTRIFDVSVVVLVAVAIWFFFIRSEPIPSCSSREVEVAVERVILSVPANKERQISNVRVFNSGDVESETTDKKRICRAQLSSSLGEEWFRFSVEWHSREGDKSFYVQIIP